MPDNAERDFTENLVLRVEDQLHWYNAKAMYLQRRSSLLRITEVVLASTLPLLISLPVPRIYPLLASVIVVVLISSSQFWQFDAKWRQYRLLVGGSSSLLGFIVLKLSARISDLTKRFVVEQKRFTSDINRIRLCVTTAEIEALLKQYYKTGR